MEFYLFNYSSTELTCIKILFPGIWAVLDHLSETEYWEGEVPSQIFNTEKKKNLTILNLSTHTVRRGTLGTKNAIRIRFFSYVWNFLAASSSLSESCPSVSVSRSSIVTLPLWWYCEDETTTYFRFVGLTKSVVFCIFSLIPDFILTVFY